MKPYSSIKSKKLTTFIIPSCIIQYNFYILVATYDYSLTDLLLLLPYRVYFYIIIFCMYLILNIYMWWNKRNEIDIEQEDEMILEENRRRMIEELRQKIEQKQALVIKHLDNQSGGLQGFDNI